MNQITDKHYDLLWKWGVPYLFMSIYLESGYTKADSISYHEGDTNYLFIAEKERKRLSKKSFILYTRDFGKYKKIVQKNQREVAIYLQKEKKVKISTLETKQLLDGFITMTEYLRKAWTVYFPVEIHSFDLVAEKLTDNNYSKKRSLQKHVKEITPLRQKQRDAINRIMYPPGPFDVYRKEITKRLKKDISHLHYKEVILLLQGKKVSSKKENNLIVGKFSQWKKISGTRARALFKQLLPFDVHAKELKGIIGNKGYYKGKVRKIDFSLQTDFQKEIKKMKKGEVLISGSTGPEMILAFKKAGAIVTEEGGMLTHAALVSREMGIPCIVGTKIVTRIFTTGDLIEVDADKGIVKKL